MYEARTIGAIDDSRYRWKKMTKSELLEGIHKMAFSFLIVWKDKCGYYEDYEEFLENYNVKKGTHICVRNIKTQKIMRISCDSKIAFEDILKMKESDINV